MESQYNRDLNRQYFRPLRSFQYRPSLHWGTATEEQLALADKIAEDYNMNPGNVLRLIVYADLALFRAQESELQRYYSDLAEITEFEATPQPIKRIVFEGETKAFRVENPYLIDHIYATIFELITARASFKKDGKKRSSSTIIKMIGTEIYNELTTRERITPFKSECILVQILSLYNIGLKRNEPLLTEEQHRAAQKARKAKGMTTQQYLTYCRGMGKNYHY